MSPATIRDWRRRGHLPRQSAAAATFTASDLAHILALKAFSDCGVPPWRADEAAKAATLPITDHIAMAAERGDGPAAAYPATRGEPDRYIVVSAGRIMRGSSLRVVEQLSDLALVVLDCEAAARQIIARAPRPPLSVRVEQRQGEAA